MEDWLEAAIPAIIQAGSRYWRALAEEDDAALADLLSEAWPQGPGMAAEHREKGTGLSRAQCLLLNSYSDLEVLAVDRLRLRYTLEPSGPVPEDFLTWPLEFVHEHDVWRVAPRTRDEAIRYIRL